MVSEIGQKIKMYRTEHGVSREKIAETLQISLAAISNWETGVSVPDARKIIPLCKILDVTPNMLFGFPDEVWTQGLDPYEISLIRGYRAASMPVRAEILQLSQRAIAEPVVVGTPFLPSNAAEYELNLKKTKEMKIKKRLSGMSTTEIISAIDAKHPSLGCCLSEELMVQVINGERCPSNELVNAFYEALAPALNDKVDDFLDQFGKVFLYVCIFGGICGGLAQIL